MIWVLLNSLTLGGKFNTKRGDRYAEEHGTGEEWLEDDFPDSDHDSLGLGLRFINMERFWANMRNMYRNKEWNNFMITTNNTFIMQLKQYAANKYRSVARLLQKPNIDMIHAVITNTLAKLFDTDEPDVLSHDNIDAHI